MMLYGEVYNDIVNSFGSLWGYKERGNTLEVITPFATTNNKFISVFVRYQEDRYIISDGGWVSYNEYQTGQMPDSDCFEKIYFHFLNSYDIKQTEDAVGRIIYYKAASKLSMVASMVFDMASFINTVVSSASIAFVEKQEEEVKQRFRSIANNFISSIVPNDQLSIGGNLGEDSPIRIDLIITKSSKLTLVNYITGSNLSYFSGSIYKANMIFEMANSSKYRDVIKNRYAIVDDIAVGYNNLKAGPLLNHLSEQTKTETLNWSARANFKNKLN